MSDRLINGVHVMNVMKMNEIDVRKPFDPSNKKVRPVMTPGGRGVLIAKTVDIEGNNPKWLVKMDNGKNTHWLYKVEEMEEVEE